MHDKEKTEEKEMKIVIIGDGKVGYKLAEELSEENYDVVLIDHNEQKLKTAINKLDIFCVSGDGVSVEVQREADVPHADLVIACMSTDELNMLSCLVARRIGARHTIARVRNPIYYQQIDLLKEDLRLSMAVNPELAVAREISRVLIFPSASKVETFVKGRLELVEFPLREGSGVIGLSLKEIYKKYKIKILVCAVQRGEEVYIPDGDFVLQQGDRLHIAATHHDIEALFKSLDDRQKKIRKVLLCGGGKVSYYLAQLLCPMGMQVKIIEKNEEKCEELCDKLPKATIICGDATDQELLIEEGIEDADAMVALTGMDEENIILSLFAKTKGVDKIVAKVNEDTRVKMVEDLGIDSIVSMKNVTVDMILGYVRARHNSLRSAKVETMYRLVEDQVEALEFIIKEDAGYVNILLKDLPLKANNLIACIGRKRQIIIPGGEDSLQVGDSVVIVTKERKIQDIKDILA